MIAFARDFLDSSAPLASGSHRDATSYAVADSALAVTLLDGSVSGLAEPSKFAGLGRPRVSPETEKAILEARKQGRGINRIAAELGVGSSTVRRVIKESEK